MNTDRKTVSYYRYNILESIKDMYGDLYFNRPVEKRDLDRLKSLTEAYCVMVNSIGDRDMIVESVSFQKNLKSISCFCECVDRHVNEGFYNPFDDLDDERQEQTTHIDFVQDPSDSDVAIRKVRLWNKNTTNKVFYKNGRMVAGKFFGTGDVIEECPVRLIYEKDLYSENVRDFAFPIDKRRGVYAIPFGYASFYRDSFSTNIEPNAEYEYVGDNNGGVIRIHAIRKIKKGHEIVLKSDKTDFANELKPYQFRYEMGEEPFYSVKNIRIA